jgi:hypothetical protein
MKIERESFLQRLQSVKAGLAVARPTVAQSDCFIFQDGQVFTFNGDCACSSDSKLGKEVHGAVEADMLQKVLAKLPDDIIDIQVSENDFVFKGEDKETQFALQADIVSPASRIVQPTSWQPLHEDFNDAVGIVQESAGRDESQQHLLCVSVTPDWVEASDNTQATRYRLRTGIETKFLVKRDAIRSIAVLGMTEFSEAENWVHFRNPANLTLSCLRFMEDYPDISEFYKAKGEKLVLPKRLKETLECAGLFSAQYDNDRVIIELKPGRLRVQGIGLSGKHVEKKDVAYTGKAMKFLISPKLLLNLIAKHSECEVTENLLLIKGGSWRYATVLISPDEA